MSVDLHVYVVMAYDIETERMTCCNVLTDLKRAQWVFSELKAIYGGANVSLHSQKVDEIDIGAPITLKDI